MSSKIVSILIMIVVFLLFFVDGMRGGGIERGGVADTRVLRRVTRSHADDGSLARLERRGGEVVGFFSNG